MTWKADLLDGRIRFHSSYSEKALPVLRDIPGGRWHKDDSWADKYGQHRSFPVTWKTCLGLRKACEAAGRELEIGPELLEWAKNEKKRLEDIPDPKSLEAVQLRNLPEVNPFMASKIKDYQTRGVAFIARNREVLVADEPGLGKTMQTIGGILEAGVTGPILIVAPKAAASITWPYEIELWVTGEKFGRIGSHLSAKKRADALQYVEDYCRDHPDERFWVITNVEYLRFRAETDQYGKYVYERGKKKINPVSPALPKMIGIEWGAIIVDESHKTLACSTLNRKKWSAQRVGLDLLQLKPEGIKAALSGTPFRGKKENLFGTLQWLRPSEYTSYWKWVDRHFETSEDDFTGGKINSGRLKDVAEFYKETAEVMIRRNKRQVATELPPKTYAGWPLYPDDPESPIAVWLEMDTAQRRSYNEFIRVGSVNLEGGTLFGHGILSEITRRKQFANSAMKMVGEDLVPVLQDSNKFQWLMQWLEERGMTDPEPMPDVSKVIIASQFTRFLNAISAELDKMEIPHFILTGETSEGKRKAAQKRFQQEGGPRIFLLNTYAGGVSLTLDAADDVIILDQTPNPDDQEQVEDRAHRISRTDHNVTIWYLASLGTIEEAIAATAFEREIGLKEIMDVQRGVHVLRNLLEGDLKAHGRSGRGSR